MSADPPPPPTGPVDDPTPATELQAAARTPLHQRDRVPTFLLRGQAWLQRWISIESRLLLSLVIVGSGAWRLWRFVRAHPAAGSSGPSAAL